MRFKIKSKVSRYYASIVQKCTHKCKKTMNKSIKIFESIVCLQNAVGIVKFS